MTVVSCQAGQEVGLPARHRYRSLDAIADRRTAPQRWPGARHCAESTRPTLTNIDTDMPVRDLAAGQLRRHIHERGRVQARLDPLLCAEESFDAATTAWQDHRATRVTMSAGEGLRRIRERPPVRRVSSLDLGLRPVGEEA